MRELHQCIYWTGIALASYIFFKCTTLLFVRETVLSNLRDIMVLISHSVDIITVYAIKFAGS